MTTCSPLPAQAHDTAPRACTRTLSPVMDEAVEPTLATTLHNDDGAPIMAAIAAPVAGATPTTAASALALLCVLQSGENWGFAVVEVVESSEWDGGSGFRPEEAATKP